MLRTATCLLLVLFCFNASFAWSAQRQDVHDKDLSSLSSSSAQSSTHRQLPREERLRQALGLGSRHSFKPKSQRTDRRGNRHTRYTQLYQGVPVWGEEVVVHEDARGRTRATGHILQGLEAPATLLQSAAARITPEAAFQALTQTFGHHQSQWKTSNIHNELVVYVDEFGAPRHAYYVHYLAEPVTPGVLTPSRPHALVDAIKGTILKQWEGLNHVETGTGPGGNTKTGSYEYGTDYGFLDVTQNGSTCTLENSNVRTVNLDHGEYGTDAYSFNCPRNTIKSINGAYSPLNDAHYFGNVVYDMYQDWLHLAPLSSQLVMRVHFSSGYENAFWDGTAMTFGDGGEMFYPLVDINVASHEVSHGFTEQNSNLIYYGESGGINEAFSDIAGEAAEFFMRGSVDWFMGGDIIKNQDGLRYFADPTRDGMSIGHARNYYQGMDVHFSSGVYNRAFYLLAHTSGWDVRKAFEAFAFANVNYWTQDETFDSAACGVQEAAHDLGYNAWDVYMAFQVVGVDCGTLPFIDLDGDSMDDNWERTNGLDPENPGDATEDQDSDGLNNLLEYQLLTNPASSDSDGDTLPDYEEVNVYHTNPANVDSDGDIMDDAFELDNDFDPLDNSDGDDDADSDGYTNNEEYEFETDPHDAGSRPAFRIYSFENNHIPLGWSIPANSGADAGWQVDANQAQHGVYSLRAAPISHSQQAMIEFTEYFSANSLSFWTRTDTEGGWDYLRVYVDGTQVLSISGSTEWTQHQINVTESEHRIRFEYYKDGSVNSGSDTVWIDNLRFLVPDEDGDGMPNRWEDEYGLDRANPADVTADADADGLSNLDEYTHGSDPNVSDSDGDTLNDGVEVHTHHTSPSSEDTDGDSMGDAYELRYGLDALDASDANEDADGDGFINADEYRYDSDPTDATSQPQIQIVSFETGRLPAGWTLPTGSNAGWGVDGTVAQHGTHSLVTQYSNDNSFSTIEFTAEFATNSLSFWTRTANNYCCGTFYVYVDDQQVLYDYGSQTWQQRQINLSEGEHRIRIRYYRGSSSDRLWLDNLRYIIPDDDHDGMPNGWEERFGLDRHDAADATLDGDADGLTNLEEFNAGANPQQSDTDGDSLSDGAEVNEHGTSPAHSDSDGDTMNDGYELRYGLDALDATDADEDADGDGVSNIDEYTYGTLPNDASSIPVVRAFSFEDGRIPNGWTFPYGGDSIWLVDSTQGQSGNQSLVNRVSYGYSTLEFTDTFAAGKLSFWTRAANAGCCGRLYVYVDGSERHYSYGLTEWHKVEIPLTEGEHTIRIRAYNSYSSDRVWLDNLSYVFPDNDHDGMTNGWEVQYGLDLNDAADAALDTDGDGLTNLEESSAGTHPRQIDSDGDGLSDFSELRTHGTSPIRADSDGDLMDDGYELDYGFDPINAADGSLDSDGDGCTNAEENSYDTDPTDASSVPTYQVFSFEDGRLPPGWSEPSNEYSNVGWATDDSMAQHGSSSLVSQNNYSYQPATIEFTAEFALNSLSFWTRPANDNCCGYFHVYIDDDYVYDTYSLTGWQEHQIPVSEGEHTVRITYRGNSTTDHMWLDNLRFILPDNDHDGLPNGWETRHQLNPADASDALLDADGDGLSNLNEYRAATNARQTDTDGDTLSDGDEVNTHATSPLTTDSDGDSMADGVELSLDLDPLDTGDGNADIDGDGVGNADEVAYDTAPDDADEFPVLSVFSFEDGTFPYRWTNAYLTNIGWAIDESEAQQGSHALVSSITDSYQTSSLMLNSEFEANSLRFWSRSDNGACCGSLRVYINGSQVYRHVGNQAWQEHVIPVPAGAHEVRIQYQGSNSNDRLWIDNLRFILQDDDGDGMPNDWEDSHGLDRDDPDDAEQDADDDGLNNLDEYLHATHPRRADTDSDELTDGEEIETHDTSPTQADSDGDTMDDGFEVAFELDPLDASDAAIDSDGDGHSNAVEYASGTDPQEESSAPTVRVISFENGWLPGEWRIPANRSVRWRVDDALAQNGSYSLTSQVTQTYQYADIEFTAEFIPGIFSFWRRSEDGGCCKYLSIYIDGYLASSYNSVTPDWTEQRIPVSAGTHTIRFSYRGGSSLGNLLLDNLRFIIPDADSDSIPNGWEVEHELNPQDSADAISDADADGLNALGEFNAGSDPGEPDSDGDTLSDGVEVNTHGSSPMQQDTDDDIMDDAFEVQHDFDPLDSTDGAQDADGDDFSNAEEFRYYSDPHDADSVPAIEIISFEDGVIPEGWQVPNAADAGWQMDTTQVQHGTTSLRAAPIGHSQSAQIEFTRDFAAGSMTFWSKTSTENCCDYLTVYVDGSQVVSRSGSTEWAEHQINVTEGEHTIRFQYSKDGSVASDSDTVWIDNLRIVALDADRDGLPTPWEVEHGLDPNDPDDAALDGDDDDLNNLDEYTQGTDPNSADSDRDALSDGDEVHTYHTSPVQTDSDRDGMNDGFEVLYALDPLDESDANEDFDADGFSNREEHDAGTDPSDPQSTPLEHLVDFENGILPKDWQIPDTADAGWSIDREEGRQNSISLRSVRIGAYQSAEIEFTADALADSLSFWTKTSSEGFRDMLRVYVDNRIVLTHSGESDWQQHLIDLSLGTHTIRFEYTKDGMVDQGQDAVWIDDVRFVSLDVDQDRMADAWERHFGLNPDNETDAGQDLDADQLNNLLEYELGTHPGVADTDGDQWTDGAEIDEHETDPLNSDTDYDSVIDSVDAFPINSEVSVDADADSLPDAWNDSCDQICQNSSGLELDPASNDTDNDGLPNPQDNDNHRDNNPPELIAPANISMVATGELTTVFFETVYADDFVDGRLQASITRSNVFAPGRHSVQWLATDRSGNTVTATQIVDILPLAVFAISQQRVNEGDAVSVLVRLNGNAPEYPILIPYALNVEQSTVNGTDHRFVNGVLTISADSLNQGVIRVETVDDGLTGEPDEILSIELVSTGEAVISNAGLGANVQHQITLIEPNRAPTVQIELTQDGAAVRDLNLKGTSALVRAQVSDANPKDTHTFVWSLNGIRLNLPAESRQITLPANNFVEGANSLQVTVMDSGSPTETASASMSLSGNMPQETEESSGGGALSWPELLLLLLCALRALYMRQKAVR